MASTAAIPGERTHGATWRAPPAASARRAAVAAVAAVAAATLAATALRGVLPGPSLALIFLVAVLVVAARHGVWAGVATPLLAFLAYNFFLVEPRFTLRVSEASDLVALGVLFVTGTTTGVLAGRLRAEADAAAARARALELLARFAHALDAAADDDAIDAAMVRHLAEIDDGSAVIVRRRLDGPAVAAAVPPATVLADEELLLAERALRRRAEGEATAPGWDGGRFAFHPLETGDAVVGTAPGPAPSRDPAQDAQLRRTILDQGGRALEAMRLSHDARVAREDAEREALRAALLSSLSHDLRTPLATILGGISTLRALGDAVPAAARADLLAAAEEEAERLSRYVADLLHLTRLKAGLELRPDWIDAADAVQGAVARARRGHPGRRYRFAAPDARLLIRSDAVLVEQAVFNLLDNAAKHAATDADIEVTVAREGGTVRVSVADAGPGIAKAARAQALEPLFHAAAGSGRCGGLGLAIAGGIVRALGGEFAIESPRADTGRGTAIHVRLPLPAEPPA